MGKRKSTKFPGVQTRESSERRWRGRPDVCYTIDYRDAAGRRVRKDVGWASQGFTATLAAEMRAKLINEAKTRRAMGDIEPPQKPACCTFAEAWEKYKRDWLAPNGKNPSFGQSLINQHLQRFMEMPLHAITAYEIDSMIAAMSRKGLAPQTIRHAAALLRRVMRRMAAWGLYSGPIPFDKIKLPKPNNARERFLTPAEAHALLDELKRRSRQTWLMALVSLHCGLRFGEIGRLAFGDINFAEMTLYIPESKSGLARHAVMTDEVARALAELPQGAATDLVFPARGGGVMREVSGVFERAVDAIGLNNTGELTPDGKPVRITDRRRRVVFHTLRHTYASWLAKSGQNQFTIADRLGHHSLAMTMRYTHLMDESRKATADAISGIFGSPPERQQ